MMHVSAEATADSLSVAALGEVHEMQHAFPKSEWPASSTQYAGYMKNVLQREKVLRREMEDTSCVLGDKLKAKDQFVDQKSYLAYMTNLKAPVEEQLGETQSGPDESDSGNGAGVRLISKNQPTAQSSVAFSAVSTRAVDGRTDAVFSAGSCTHTEVEENPWWRVDLGDTMNIQHIEVYNRGDCCGARLSRFEVRIGDKDTWQENPKCGDKYGVVQGGEIKIPCPAFQGRYVFIHIPATEALSLCEVKVYGSDSPGANAARGAKTKQSSTTAGGSADRAVDGHINGDFVAGSCTHTSVENEPWWQVDLGSLHTVATVEVYNRADCCGSRLSNFEVRVGNVVDVWSSASKCGDMHKVDQGGMLAINCDGQRGRYVWVVLRKTEALTLCEVRVLTTYGKEGINIGRDKQTEQSSTGYGGVSSRAVDGKTDTNAADGSCTHTHLDNEPWWRVDLVQQHAIGVVQIWNRGDCCGSRLSNFEVRVGNQPTWQDNKVCGEQRYRIGQGARGNIICGGLLGRYVHVVIRNQGYLSLCEVRIIEWKAKDGAGTACISEPLGLEDRKIEKDYLSASSFAGDINSNGPDNARLNYKGSAWKAMNSIPGQWLQVQLKKALWVTGVAVQGDTGSNNWVTEFKVQFMGKDGSWHFTDGGATYQGSVDRDLPVKIDFKIPVQTAKVRIYPTAWSGEIMMRAELYGRECNKPEEVVALKKMDPEAACGARRRALTLKAKPGYGEGEAEIWYAADKGLGNSDIRGNSVYVSKGIDFRTESGSIYSAKDLVANKYLQINSWAGYGFGSAKLWYTKNKIKEFEANTLYLDNGDFSTRTGSISASNEIVAGKYLSIKAAKGFGEGTANFWYSENGKGAQGSEYSAQTVYLKDGDFATEKGSISSSEDIIAGRYLSVKAMANYGSGEAQFWYVGAGKAPYKSNTLYLKNGNFATEAGSISAKYDVVAGQSIRINALEGYGSGETSLWYAKESANGFPANTLFVKTGDIFASDGNVVANKNLVAGRAVQINAWPEYGAGMAELWYSETGKGDIASKSLYLKSGDFRTEAGSIVASKNLVAGESVQISSLPGHGTGFGELVYTETAKGGLAGKSLYVKSGDFRTMAGSIYSAKNLVASEYLEIRAFPGFGSGSAKLWHCNADKEGYVANTLYLKEGDFKTADGSIIASKDVVASRYLTINAKKGFGDGKVNLWYSKTGRGEFRSNSLYVQGGDFRTESGSIYAAESLHASKYLKIASWPGHGNGYAKLWHSQSGNKGFGANTLYLDSGHFQTQTGSVIAKKDLHAGRFVTLNAMDGFGTGSAKLWYSGNGKGDIAPKTLYLQSGDFRTQEGNIISAKDVIAKGSLYGNKLEVDEAFVSGQITAGHLYLGVTKKKETEEGLELLETDEGHESLEVGQMLSEMTENNIKLGQRNHELMGELQNVLSRLTKLEAASRR